MPEPTESPCAGIIEALESLLQEVREETITWTEVRKRHHRIGLALRYAMGTWTEDDAWDLQSDIRELTGAYPLEELSRNDVLEIAQELWGDNPFLSNLVNQACHRTWIKWNCDGYAADAASGQAIDLVREYADREGIKLVKVEGTKDQEAP